MRIGGIVLIIMLLAGWAHGAPQLQGVRSYPGEDQFVTELTFDQPISASLVQVRYSHNTIVATVTNAQFNKKKTSHFINNKKRGLRFVEAEQEKSAAVSARLVFKDVGSAEVYRDKVGIKSKGKVVQIVLKDQSGKEGEGASELSAAQEQFNPDVSPLRLAVQEPTTTKNLEVDGLEKKQGFKEELFKKFEAATSQPPELAIASPTGKKVADVGRENAESISATKLEEAAQPLGWKAAIQDQDEGSIPLRLNTEKSARSDADHLRKLILSLAILFVGVGLTVFYLKRGLRNRPPTGSDRSIRILASHYLGPKRSLALVSVAGETMLIGITDQNINLIKNLALLEEEVPAQVPKDFKTSLASVQDPEMEEEFAMAGLREVVAKKLKQMRPI